MSRAKLKITVRERKSGQGGKLLTRIPLTVEKNDNPSGKRLYQTKAQVSIRAKTTIGGKPRVSRKR